MHNNFKIYIYSDTSKSLLKSFLINKEKDLARFYLCQLFEKFPLQYERQNTDLIIFL